VTAGIIAAGGAAALAFAGPGGSAAAAHNSFTNGLPPIVGASSGGSLPDVPGVGSVTNLASYPFGTSFAGSLPLPVSSLLNSGFANLPIGSIPAPTAPQLPIQGPISNPPGGGGTPQQTPSLPVGVPGTGSLPGVGSVTGVVGTITNTLDGATGGTSGLGAVTGVVGTITNTLGGATGSTTGGTTTTSVPGVGSVTGVVGTITNTVGGATGGSTGTCPTSGLPLVGGVVCSLLP
jgi:hypothetical protein